jgi:diphosphomevalonate decarboxylase
MENKPALSSTWQSPSNLAIVKYWGKKGFQEPVNPSVSFSLQAATTTTRVAISPRKRGGFSFRMANKEIPAFQEKIKKFLDLIRFRLPIINHYFLDIESTNTFPHSAGIASSASAMSALAFCLTDLQQQTSGQSNLDISEVSSIARIGSGSAARSVYGGWNLWGRLSEVPESSDNYAIPVPANIKKNFQTLKDDILIVSSQPKPVSSRTGHALMDHHPYRQGRISQGRENTLKLLKHLQDGNLEGFIEVTETEALSLHALMMSSTPAFMLMLPNSLIMIDEIKTFRKKKDIPVTFTLDAGPNIHMLYPEEFSSEILEWQQKRIKPLCENGCILHDSVGKGPRKIIKTN